jgi:hypothetical protein
MNTPMLQRLSFIQYMREHWNFNDRTKVTFEEFEKASDESAFYDNAFDTPIFEFEDNDKNIDQSVLHKHGVMDTHAKSTHKEVCVYPAELKKEKEDKIIQTANNDNDIDIYSENEKYEKTKAQDIKAGMTLFHSPVFHAPVGTMSTAIEEKYFLFKAVPEEAGIDASNAQRRTWDEAFISYFHLILQ